MKCTNKNCEKDAELKIKLQHIGMYLTVCLDHYKEAEQIADAVTGGKYRDWEIDAL